MPAAALAVTQQPTHLTRQELIQQIRQAIVVEILALLVSSGTTDNSTYCR